MSNSIVCQQFGHSFVTLSLRLSGKVYNDLGLSFSQLKLFQETAGCYERALPLVSTRPSRLAVVLQNLGAVHNTLSQYRQALDYHRQAASLHGELITSITLESLVILYFLHSSVLLCTACNNDMPFSMRFSPKYSACILFV